MGRRTDGTTAYCQAGTNNDLRQMGPEVFIFLFCHRLSLLFYNP
jgi:hypothetical protein